QSVPPLRGEGADLPVKRAGDVEARLHIGLPDEDATQGRPRVWLILTFDGPTTLDVQQPRLEDAVAGWRVARQTSAWRMEKSRVRWSWLLRLEQVKDGQVPLPGVVVGVRDGPEASWQTVSWMQPLHESADVRPHDPLAPLPPSRWPERLRWIGLSVAV